MKFRVHVIEGGRVRDTVHLEADCLDAAEFGAEQEVGAGERYLVEPIVACAGCGAEMQQMDPRSARYADGTPVHPDPERAYEGIRCLACGPVR
jgi:hypothetical protein